MPKANSLAVEQAIRRRSLHHEVTGRLRELIYSGEIEPLSRINESDLTQRFGISRTPLREAIKVLAAEGLLELLPNRGARVTRISTKEIEEITEVMAGLEATAAELACQRITTNELKQIRSLHEEMIAAFHNSDAVSFGLRNRKIHDAILKSSRNDKLQEVYFNLSGRIQAARYAARKTVEQWNEAMEDHNKMLKLLEDRNGAALGELMRRHILGKKTIIARSFGSDASNASD